MPVKLYTGLPGAGKTAQLVADIVRLKDKEPERAVYQRGINGLQDGLAIPITDDQLHNWRQELAPGSIICIDECQENGLMPLDRGQPAAWVKDISKVRHEGMQFLLTTQHPSLMSAYVRKLVDEHVHFVRMFNTKTVTRFMWGRCMETPEKRSTQKAGTQSIATLPSKVFDLYKSASLHTMKKRVPFKVYFLGACAVCFIGAIVAAPLVLKHLRSKALEAQHTGLEGNPQSTVTESNSLRLANYGKWLAPRVDGLPWTAPAFDKLQVTAKPQVFCVAVDDGRCKCITEQGTDLVVALKVCRQIAAHGVYNPFEVVQQQEPAARRHDTDHGEEPPSAARRGGVVAADPSGIGGYRAGVGTSSYTPPELTSATGSQAK